MTSNFFSPLSFVAVFGSGIRDPGSGMGKNQDPGSGINIPDPQHCLQLKENLEKLLTLFREGAGGSRAWPHRDQQALGWPSLPGLCQRFALF